MIIISTLWFSANVIIVFPTLLLILVIPKKGTLIFCDINSACRITSLLFSFTEGIFSMISGEITFKPIIDKDDCFEIFNANFKPLREFVEPSKGTKILFSNLRVSTNYCTNYYLQNMLKFKHDNKNCISARML